MRVRSLYRQGLLEDAFQHYKMSSRGSSSISTRRRQTKGPFRLTTPSTESQAQSLSDSKTSATSSAPSRSPSILSTDTSSTSSDDDADNYSPNLFQRQEIPVDDTDAPTDASSPITITEAIRRAKLKGDYSPSDQSLPPPTPDQLHRRRKRKSKKLLYTFVRQHTTSPTTLPARRGVFVDPKVEKRVIEVDKTNWQSIASVNVPAYPMDREGYVMNSAEFIPVKIIGRVYKPTLRGRSSFYEPTFRRRRTVYQKQIDQGIGIGGYIVQFHDGHEVCVLPKYITLGFS